MAQRIRLSQLLLIASTVLAADLTPIPLDAQASSPTRILVCESAKSACSQPGAHLDIVWTLNGTEGTATSPDNQSGSRITIEKFDSDSIVVRRVDDSGPTSGMTSIYTGAVHGTNIIGTVNWTWPGHPNYPATGSFSAVLQDAPAAAAPAAISATPADTTLPEELLVCENNGPCNAAWHLKGSEGSGTWFAQKLIHARLTVIRSAPDDIRIHRVDTMDGVSANYVGSLRGDHYSGTIIWSNGEHPGQSTGTWTARVPQTSCATQPNPGADEAMRIGQVALMFQQDREALGCYIVAAKAGDAMAQTIVGLTYYQGRETIPQDYSQAFIWLHKAADQGIYNAQRTIAEMYLAGQGTHRDPTMAQIYTARADEQKHDVERQQDLNDREADRRAQILSSFVLGASFGMFF
jgi:hypothetical protein